MEKVTFAVQALPHPFFSFVVLPVHKVLLAIRSEYFSSMFGSGLAESSSRRIKIREVTAPTMLHLLEYLYAPRSLAVASFEADTAARSPTYAPWKMQWRLSLPATDSSLPVRNS